MKQIVYVSICLIAESGHRVNLLLIQPYHGHHFGFIIMNFGMQPENG